MKLVENNYDFFYKKAYEENRIIAPVLKSDAYGFGTTLVAKLLYRKGARIFFTSDVYEAIEVSKSILYNDVTIYTLNGYFSEKNLKFKNIYPVINCYKELSLYSKALTDKGIEKSCIAIQLNTGMNRGGFCLKTAQEMIKNIQLGYYKNINICMYLTHLCSIVQSKNDEQEYSLRQFDLLNEFLKILPKRAISITATHGTLYIQHLKKMPVEQSIERIGIGIFGDIPGYEFAFSAWARILSIHHVAAGDTIGYDCAYTANKNMKVAIIDIGYGDGYPRNVSVKNNPTSQKMAYMSIGGHKAYIVGIVSMNLTCIDVTDIPETIIAKEKYAEIIGNNISIYYLADCANTTIEDILIALNRKNIRAQDYITY